MVILLGDFNVEVGKKNMSEFIGLCNLRNLVKQKNCFMNPEIIYRSYPHQLPARFFQNKVAFETGLSDFHKLTIRVLK